MNMEFIRKLPIPKELKAQFSLSEKLVNVKAKRDAEIKKVFTGESDKKLLIIGPCSADREDAVLDYVSRLAKVQEKVQDKLLLIPRIYTNKPAPLVKATRAWCTSRIRRKRKICCRD